MKKFTDNSMKSKNQTTLGQYWAPKEPKIVKTDTKQQSIVEEDDDIELLTAMEDFEKNNNPNSSLKSTNTNVTKSKIMPPPTTTASTSKWPISHKPEQNSKQLYEASISAPPNDNEQMQTYSDFDRQAGQMWIYPTNYEKRDYQFKIVSMALFQNTLVILPTGLGKTFIAAVVMFNYCRWYPTGKIIFTAPTKPLVAQQMDACAKVMGIKRSEMCEMTGGVTPDERKRLWLEKRVFFLTPQTLNNDLVKSTCPWSKIRCLVIDEAHRALGQHAYCQVVQELCGNGEQFRILALSATPGNNVEAVQNVINNLKISHIEMFTDDSPQIKKYSFDKIVDKIIVGPNQLMQNLRQCILNILKQPVETLNKLGVIYQKNPEHVTNGSIVLTMKRVLKDRPTNLNDKQYQEAKSALFFAVSFYHALDELEKHGLQSVYNFFKKKLTDDKKSAILIATFRNNPRLNEIYIQLQNLFDLSQVDAQQRSKTSLSIAHPKLQKLRECVVEHFQTFERTKTKATDQTRVIIFSEKRDSVREITDVLEQDRPLIKPMAFIGQASSHAAGQGINQKLQKKVVNEFRAGGYNVLVATSIGEEGLDIGSVDLIICFDALKSPIRLVQRMGRTGRARQGRIVLLMTEGKEERTFYEGEAQQKRIFKLIVDGARMLQLYRNNLRMVPHEIQPLCQEMTIKISNEIDSHETDNKKKFKTNESDFKSVINKTKRQENLLKLFRKDKLLTDYEFYHWVRNYQLHDDSNDDDGDGDESEALSSKDHMEKLIEVAIRKWLNEQRKIQSFSMCSSRTKIFVNFMETYTNERIYVDIPQDPWPIEEIIVKPEPIEAKIAIPYRPTMPSPYDRSKLKEQLQSKQACSPVNLSEISDECDKLLNLQPIVQYQQNQQVEDKQETNDEEIDCGDLFGTGTTFDISCTHFEPTLPSTFNEPTQENVGNFNITMDDLFPASQQSHSSPTLQLNDVKSQQNSAFDDNGMDDDELLEAFNKHSESSANQLTQPSPILVLSNRVNTQASMPTTNITLPKFDLEFSFDDFDNDDNQSDHGLDITKHETKTKANVTICSDKFDTPIRPVPSKKRVRRLSTTTPDITEKKRSKSAQELNVRQNQERHFHRRLASDFLDEEAIVDESSAQLVSSDEDEDDDQHEDQHDHFIDDRQVLTQMANVDMTSVYLKSIKSPKVNFRVPPVRVPIEDIYSQLPHMTMHDDTDEENDEDDSFVDDTTEIVDDHHGEVDFDELANILGTQSVVHRQSKVTRRGVKFGRTSETTTPRRKPKRRVQIAQSPL